MPLRLLGSGTGYSQIDAPAIAGDQTFTLPDTGGTLDRLNRIGNILQVVPGSANTQVTITSTTYTDSGLTATITPTFSTSKILVIVDQGFSITRSAASVSAGARLLRGSTVIHEPVADATGPYDIGIGTTSGGTSTTMNARNSIVYLDSPATTSATVYKTQGRPYNTANSHTLYFQPTGTTVATSYIYLIEVAA